METYKMEYSRRQKEARTTRLLLAFSASLAVAYLFINYTTEFKGLSKLFVSNDVAVDLGKDEFETNDDVYRLPSQQAAQSQPQVIIPEYRPVENLPELPTAPAQPEKPALSNAPIGDGTPPSGGGGGSAPHSTPAPPPIEISETPPHTRVERMPRFGKCQDSNESEEVVRKCTEKALIEYIMSCVKYTEIAKAGHIEGTVVAQFVVDKEGQVVDIKILREPGGGLGNSVLSVLSRMPKFKPGYQNGRPAKVLYNIPVKFKLN